MCLDLYNIELSSRHTKSVFHACFHSWVLFESRGPPGGFGEQGKEGIYFRGTGESRPNFEGNRGTKTILGNSEHKKTNFRFLGNTEGNKPIYFRGTREHVSPSPREGLRLCIAFIIYCIYAHQQRRAVFSYQVVQVKTTHGVFLSSCTVKDNARCFPIKLYS